MGQSTTMIAAPSKLVGEHSRRLDHLLLVGCTGDWAFGVAVVKVTQFGVA